MSKDHYTNAYLYVTVLRKRYPDALEEEEWDDLEEKVTDLIKKSNELFALHPGFTMGGE